MLTATAPIAPDATAPTVSAITPAVIELRQYTLHPGRRETLVGLFEHEFIEPQEAAGMRVLGTFRDLDDPDRFVWLRGFADMRSRAAALAAFYDGPAWRRHRDEANATMVDSDDVLLLRPAGCVRGLLEAASARAGVDAPAQDVAAVFTLTLCPLREPAADAVFAAFDNLVHPWWIGVGGDLLACFVTEGAANDFPRLPVREGEPHIAWLTRFPDAAAQRRHAALLESSGCLRQPAWRALLREDARELRLAPTRRSALRG